ncbi:ABC transporter permease [Gabonibacter massiliensis]|uniref:ABC transporter permease n=1 Tax=Gabonibacter massiliensis TaxID=1720195 RepID=UPI00073EB20E|nr:ABC transporter permease [Gabonibacter massiliensis]
MIKELYNLYVGRWHFFLNLTLQHIEISVISIVLATIIGLGLGIFISQYKRSSSTVLGITNFIYTIPSIALFGFLIPFSGIGNTTAIVALTVYALLPMVRNTYTGITGIDKEITEAAKGMGSTPFQILYKIELPLAFPVILSGIRNMVVMTIALAGIAAFIGAGGLGVAIYRGITTNNSAMTVAGSLLIAVLALLADWGVGCYEKYIKRKRKLI